MSGMRMVDHEGRELSADEKRKIFPRGVHMANGGGQSRFAPSAIAARSAAKRRADNAKAANRRDLANTQQQARHKPVNRIRARIMSLRVAIATHRQLGGSFFKRQTAHRDLANSGGHAMQIDPKRTIDQVSALLEMLNLSLPPGTTAENLNDQLDTLLAVLEMLQPTPDTDPPPLGTVPVLTEATDLANRNRPRSQARRLPQPTAAEVAEGHRILMGKSTFRK